MGCGCFALLLGTLFPRVAIVLLWIFRSGWFTPVAGMGGLPYLAAMVLGLIFLPYTLLWTSFVLNSYPGWGPVQIGVLIVALIFDLSPLLARRLHRGRE
jgi:hypothetical protein